MTEDGWFCTKLLVGGLLLGALLSIPVVLWIVT